MSALPDYAGALDRVLGGVRPLARPETVDLADAAGRVLAARITADRDLPPFDRAQMDGYAVRHAELAVGSSWPVTQVIAAGQPADVTVPAGACVAIATGAPLPADVDTVVPHELSDRADPVHFTTRDIACGHAVHPRGSDARAGDTLIVAGTTLAAHHLGLAAAAGAARLAVAGRPRAIVLTSGDEVRGIDEPVADHQIRNSNGPQTLELLRRFGADSIGHHHVGDETDETRSAVATAVAAADLVVTIGGISVGVRDRFPEAFEAAGVRPLLHGAAIQPGKPVFAGRTDEGTMVIGLPGNPVSSLVCACLFVWPVVRTQLGAGPTLAWRTATAADGVRPNPRRRAFRPATIDADGVVAVPRWAGSGDLAHTAVTDGIAELPIREGVVPPGTTLRFLAWP